MYCVSRPINVSEASVTESVPRPPGRRERKILPWTRNQQVSGLGALVMIAVFQHNIISDQVYFPSL